MGKITNLEEIKFDSFEAFYNKVLIKNSFNLNFDNYIFRGQSRSGYDLTPSALRCRGRDLINKIIDQKKSSLDGKYLGNAFDELEAVYNFYVFANSKGFYLPDVYDFKFLYFQELTRKIYFDNISETFFNKFSNPKSNDYKEKSIKWIPSEYYEIFSIAQHYGVPTRLLDWTRDIHAAIYFAINNLDKCKLNTNGFFAIWMLNAKLLVDNMRELINNYHYNFKFIVPRYYKNPNIIAQAGVFFLR